MMINPMRRQSTCTRRFCWPLPRWRIERVQQHRIGAGQLIGLAQVLAPAFERLLVDHRPSVAFHRGIVRGDELCRDHPFYFIFVEVASFI